MRMDVGAGNGDLVELESRATVDLDGRSSGKTSKGCNGDSGRGRRHVEAKTNEWIAERTTREGWR